MKSQKGITLTSLVVYIVVLLIVLGLLSNISKYFYSNTKYITDANKYVSEFNKFNMYFIEDVKNNTNLYSIKNNQIIFEDGTMYTFDKKSIYRNKVEICNNIQICTFDKVEETDKNGFTKQIIKVKFAVKSSEIFAVENDYVLKYW